MRTALILATVADRRTAAVSAPAEAGHRGWVPASAWVWPPAHWRQGAFAASQPYSYDGYYRPRYRRVYYGPGPYYDGPRYYGPRYYYD